MELVFPFQLSLKLMSLGNMYKNKREKTAEQQKEAKEIRISCALVFLGCLTTAAQARHDPAGIKLYVLHLNLWCWTFSFYLVHSSIL